MELEDATSILKNDFEKTTPDNLIYGKTILTFYGDGAGATYKNSTTGKREKNYQHIGVYAGTDRKGNV